MARDIPPQEVTDSSVLAIDENEPVRALEQLYRRLQALDQLIASLETYRQTAKQPRPPATINAPQRCP